MKKFNNLEEVKDRLTLVNTILEQGSELKWHFGKQKQIELSPSRRKNFVEEQFTLNMIIKTNTPKNEKPGV